MIWKEKVAHLGIIITLLLHIGCNDFNYSNSKKLGIILSSGFPDPFFSNCDTLLFGPEAIALISEEFKLTYSNLHQHLYTYVDLSQVPNLIQELEDLIKEQSSSVREWLSVRLMIDESYYHMRQRNIPLGIATAELALLQCERLDAIIKVDVYIVLAELRYMFLEFDKSLSLLATAEMILGDHQDQLDRYVKIKKLQVRNYNNNDQLDRALLILDSLQRICTDEDFCLAEIERFRGINYHFRGDENKAEETLSHSASIFKNIECPDLYSYSITLDGLANASSKNDLFEKARSYFEYAYAIYNRSNNNGKGNSDDIYNIRLLSGIIMSISDQAIDQRDTLLGQKAYSMTEDISLLIDYHTRFDKDTRIHNKYYHNFYYTYVIRLCSLMFEETGSEDWIKRMLKHVIEYKGVALVQDLNLNSLWDSQDNQHQHIVKEIIRNDQKLESAIIKEHSKTLLDSKLVFEKQQLIKEREELIHTIRSEYTSLYQQLFVGIQSELNKIVDESKRDNVARIAFYVGDNIYNSNQIHALSIFNGVLNYYKINNADFILNKIDTLIHWQSVSLPSKIHDIISYQDLSNTVYVLLFDRIYDQIREAKEIFVLGDQQISILPFESLIIRKDSLAKNYSELDFLIKHQDISYGFLLKELNETTLSTIEEERMFVMGWSDNATIKNKSYNSIVELPGAFNELEWMQDYFDPIIDGYYLSGLDATKKNFIKNAPGSTLIHLALHAKGGHTNRLDSKLYFRNGHKVDSLTVNELMYQGIRPKLIVLSSCETHKGKMQESEGAFSIARGFYKVGANSVISNLWELDDHSARTIFQLFYEQLMTTKDISKSNSEAKRLFLNKCSRMQCHPHYWAGLSLHY